MRWKGVFVATVTPFSRGNGGVDYVCYEKHLEWLAHQGVHGYVPCGTTGEGSTLSSEERNKLIELSCLHAHAKKLKVIAGCGSNNTQDVLRMMQESKSIGADAALVVTPYYNKPTQEGLLAHYRYLADHGSLPIILYNVPSRTNVALSIPTIEKLFEHENIVGIKEASGQFGNWLGLSVATDLTKKSLMAGDDDAHAIICQLGGTGIISASANVVPQAFVKIQKLAEEGAWEAAYAEQKRIYPLIKAMFIETNPSPAKCALKHMKRMEDTVRLPLVGLTPKNEEDVVRNLKKLGLL